MKNRLFALISVSVLCAALLAGCAAKPAAPAASPADTAGALATVTAGKLTIATGEPAWEPWVKDDAPESGEGFEAAFAYALADKLGFAKEDVVWVRTGFEEAIQPGPKNFDFNLQQFSITEERKEAVDFSSLYYKEPLAVITVKDNAFAGAKTIADLKGALFGAASGDIAYEFTKKAINPSQDVALFNDLAAVIQALSAGQIDAVVVGVTTAFYNVYIDDEQLPDGVIVGRITGSEDAGEGYGLLFEKGSPLVGTVSTAIDALRADGTIDALAEKWLGQYNDVPELK
jgi:polar amino acid transport system substrate-binding protein